MATNDAMNLNVAMDITQMKAAMVEMNSSITAMSAKFSMVANNTTAWDKQIMKAGRTLTGIGRGGLFIGIWQGISKAIELTKQWDASLEKVVNKGQKRAEGAFGLSQGWGKKRSVEDSVRLTRGAYQLGAAHGLLPEQVEKAAAAVQKRTRNKSADDAMAILDNQMRLVASGMDPEQAAKVARKGYAAEDEVRKRERIQGGVGQVLPGTAGFRGVRSAEARLAGDQMLSETAESRKTRLEAASDQMEKIARARQQRALGGGDVDPNETGAVATFWRGLSSGLLTGRGANLSGLGLGYVFDPNLGEASRNVEYLKNIADNTGTAGSR